MTDRTPAGAGQRSPEHQASAAAASLSPGEEPGEFLLRNLLDAPGAITFVKDLQSRFVRVSPACAALTGRTPEQMVGLSDVDLTDAEHAAELRAEEQRIIATGEPLLDKTEVDRLANQPGTWVETSKFPLRDADGRIVGTFGHSRDVTRRVEAEREVVRIAQEAAEAHARLMVVEAQLRDVLNGSTDAIAMYDVDLRYRYVNPAGERSRGVTADQLIGRTDREIGMAEDWLDAWEPTLRQVLETGTSQQVEFSVSDAHGAEDWFHTTVSPDRDATGAVVGVLTSTRDITELKRSEQALAHQATHDSLTGLANRYLLTDRLGRALVRMERAPSRLAILFVDVDHFKDVNDTHGHDVGDGVLVEVAHRLEAVARREDTVARLGGDEFVILVDGSPTEAAVAHVADRIVRAMSEPFELGPVTLRLSASVGAVVTTDPGVGASALLRNADSAMYRAKEAGRNRFEIFDPQTTVSLVRSPGLESEIRSALARGEFALVYQPRLALGEQRVLGFEALLRWEHPVRGTVRPDDFLTVAEASGLIVPIGAWVLDAACGQLASWRAQPGAAAEALTVSVNVAGRQLRERGFVGAVRGTLDRHGLPPGRLCLEIHEEDLVEEDTRVRHALDALATMGVQLAVDGFRARYTSLTRLPRFPVGVVKIAHGTATAHERGIIAAIIAMAHGLGMSVVGAGIETPDQLEELVALDCDDGQGYLLGRPLSAADATGLVQAGAAGSGEE